MVLSVIVVVGYLVMCSLSAGTSLPEVANGEWGIDYTNNVVRPLLSLFSSLTFGNVLLMVLWGFGGLVVYFLVEYGVRIARNLSSAKHTVLLTRSGVVQHPTMKAFILAVVWRFGVLAVFVPTLIVGLQWPLQTLTVWGPRVVLGGVPDQHVTLHLLGLALAFALLFHGVVAFLRLLSMRTRLLGADTPA